MLVNSNDDVRLNGASRDQFISQTISEGTEDDDDDSQIMNNIAGPNMPKNHSFNQDISRPIGLKNQANKLSGKDVMPSGNPQMLQKKNQRLRPKMIMSDDIPVLDRLK